ncbi:MAG TPA: F0F1 ATP synthase subunit B [Gemmataceae bacterium]
MIRKIPWCRAALACLVALCLAALPAPALAVEEHGGKPDFVKASGLERWDLGLWTLVVFCGLLFVLGRYAWGPIMEGLQKREDIIRQARDDAVKARDEAQALRDELKKELGKAHEQARAILEEARRDAAAFKEAERSRAMADAQTERERLRREIEMAKDQALQEIWTQSVQLAALMSAKAVRRELSAEDHRRLLDEALAELRGQLNGQRKATGAA